MTRPARSPKVVRVQLGRELRALREVAGLSREELAERFGWHASKVSRIEQGHATVAADELTNLLALFGPPEDAVERIRRLGQEARKRGTYGKVPDWARGYIGMEADADRLRIYEAELVHGLLQTESYAKAVLSTSVVVAPADIDRSVQNRMQRAELLTRENALEAHFVLGEAALHREVGGRAVLLDQLHHLRKIAALPNVTFQVLTFAAGEHASLGTGFTLLDLFDIGATYVYLEDLTSSDFWDKRSHTDVYEMVFSRLCASALGERETLAVLDKAIARLS
ncbi:helix-turn-helix transcriptional regulator [Saccharopolyspora cebuensis]|uniref:Helix-turn-helix domain-containing protein n=1 Tax=Saccharopolyspora cebuensis TaxID=418759 RepID=A0ABV4CQ26_9PSEU